MYSLLVLGFGALITIADTTSLVATDVIRAGDAVTAANTSTGTGERSPEDSALLGRVVRRTVYAGQPILPENTQSPRLVARNQLVSVRYIDGPLEIVITGRAMGEAGEGETVDVMNPQSRQLITGVVTPEGWIRAQ